MEITLNYFSKFSDKLEEFTTEIILIDFQVPILKEKLREKERQLTEISNSSVMNVGWHQAISEAKRQYDAIDGALEVAFN